MANIRNRGPKPIDGDDKRFEEVDSALPWGEVLATTQPLQCWDCSARNKRQCNVKGDTIDAHGSCVVTREQIAKYIESHRSLRRS